MMHFHLANAVQAAPSPPLAPAVPGHKRPLPRDGIQSREAVTAAAAVVVAAAAAAGMLDAAAAAPPCARPQPLQADLPLPATVDAALLQDATLRARLLQYLHAQRDAAHGQAFDLWVDALAFAPLFTDLAIMCRHVRRTHARARTEDVLQAILHSLGAGFFATMADMHALARILEALAPDACSARDRDQVSCGVDSSRNARNTAAAAGASARPPAHGEGGSLVKTRSAPSLPHFIPACTTPPPRKQCQQPPQQAQQQQPLQLQQQQQPHASGQVRDIARRLSHWSKAAFFDAFERTVTAGQIKGDRVSVGTLEAILRVMERDMDAQFLAYTTFQLFQLFSAPRSSALSLSELSRLVNAVEDARRP